MKSMRKTIAALWVIAALIPAAASGQDAENQGYLLDQNGTNVISPAARLCWRDSDWTPSRAFERCDATFMPVAVARVPDTNAILIAVAPPAEVAQTPSQQPLPQRMSFSTDALFAFAKAELTPEGRTMLDDLARQLGGAMFDTILVTGHADRFGTVEYNRQLSIRRANAVKDYLVSKDIPAGRIYAEGMGDTQPVTRAGECAGAKSARVVACLQPDRRVDVEMRGTKTLAGIP